MHDRGEPFPVFNRIVVFVISITILVGLAAAMLFSPKFRAELTFVTGFVYLVFAGIACLGVWFAVAFRNRTSDQLAAMRSPADTLDADLPTSEDALVCRFQVLSGTASVIFDQQTQRLYFRNCHVPRRFLGSAEGQYQCSIDDIKALHVFSYRGEWLTIVTADGKVEVPSLAGNYQALRQTLKDRIAHNQPGYATSHPMMGMVYLAGVLAGLFLGLWLTPENVADGPMGVIVLCSMAAGAAVAYILVLFSDRCVGFGMAQPIGYGLAAACAAVATHRVMVDHIGWDAVVPMVTVSSVIGFGFGIVRQSREQHPNRTKPEQT